MTIPKKTIEADMIKASVMIDRSPVSEHAAYAQSQVGR
jgi:hypothetical protein